MNKAFVREDDGEEEEGGPAGAAALPEGAKNYMTPQGHATLRAELERLLKVERPALVQTVAWAASNGDRSENGDYIYGKKRLREIDRRIRFLMKRLESAVLVDPRERANVDQVFFGATVTVCDEAGAEATYQIVGVDEADAAAGKISWISPLARALIKARAGDAVRFDSPAGPRQLDILRLRYV
ncbi:MAG: transcription elongation factor GreB [Pseudorhodoplanes sp.]|nr:transcription elongation factor GreB [Pseudorhodoplanes sp.]